jgi:Ni/Fe-hydrogenase subunit HybB-like protein
MGCWYLVELIGFVVIPCILFLQGMKRKSLAIIRVAAIMTLIGILLNRLNVSVIAFKWYSPARYFPSWMEVEVTLAILFAEIWVFRWVVSRMPVLRRPPEWAVAQEAQERMAQHPGIAREAVSWKTQVM